MTGTTTVVGSLAIRSSSGSSHPVNDGSDFMSGSGWDLLVRDTSHHVNREGHIRAKDSSSNCQPRSDTLVITHVPLRLEEDWGGVEGGIKLDERKTQNCKKGRIPGNRQRMQSYILTYSRLQRESLW